MCCKWAFLNMYLYQQNDRTANRMFVTHCRKTLHFLYQFLCIGDQFGSVITTRQDCRTQCYTLLFAFKFIPHKYKMVSPLASFFFLSFPLVFSHILGPRYYKALQYYSPPLPLPGSVILKSNAPKPWGSSDSVLHLISPTRRLSRNASLPLSPWCPWSIIRNNSLTEIKREPHLLEYNCISQFMYISTYGFFLSEVILGIKLSSKNLPYLL